PEFEDSDVDEVCGLADKKQKMKREEKLKTAVNPTFSLCCQRGKLLLPRFNEAPPPLNHLLSLNDASTSKFTEQIRAYNSMFYFTSFSAKIDHSINTVTRGDTSAAGLGKRIVLPRRFTRSLRYMMQNYQDAMALWQKSHDRPEIRTRVLKIKLNELLDDMTKKHMFGESRGVVYVIEFQKRDLPHVHILIWMEERCKCKTPNEIDDIILAELSSPMDNPDGYK
nr:hypothetical protein [Tanacetum cinerariifolium]